MVPYVEVNNVYVNKVYVNSDITCDDTLEDLGVYVTSKPESRVLNAASTSGNREAGFFIEINK